MSPIYDIMVKTAEGSELTLAEYDGKVLLIVNTASKCGFTPQYKELQQLYNTWHNKGLEILAFPCDQFGHQEPGEDSEIQQFCQINFGVTFPVFAKIEVNGKNAHPLYRFLCSQKKGILGGEIKWNFTKFLIDRHGRVVDRYAPNVQPISISPMIENLLVYS